MDLNQLLPNGRRATSADLEIRSQKLREQHESERKAQNMEKEIKADVAKKEYEKLKNEIKEDILKEIKVSLERVKNEIIGAGEAKKAETK